MTKTYCDICGKEQNGEKGWISSQKQLTAEGEQSLPRGINGILSLCKVEDCCPTCFRYASDIKVQQVLLDKWKEAVKKGREVM